MSTNGGIGYYEYLNMTYFERQIVINEINRINRENG